MKKPIVELKNSKWWVCGNINGVEEMGPYDTKKEAEEARKGLWQFLRHENDPGFITCEGDLSDGKSD